MQRPEQKKFVYVPPTGAAVKKRAEQSGGMFDNWILPTFKSWAAKPGDRLIRAMPATFEGAEHYGLDVWLHSSIGPNNDTYICAAKMNMGTCCICESEQSLRRSGNVEGADEIKPYRRVVIWMVDRDVEKDGPQVYPMPWTIDRDISSMAIDKRTGELFLPDHPDDGYDIMFTKKGTGRNTEYVGISLARRPSPLSDDPATQERWLQYITDNPLPTVLKYYEQDYIKKVYDGKVAKDSSGVKDTAPATRNARSEAPAQSASPARRQSAPPKEAEAPAPAEKPIYDANASIDGDDGDLPPPPRRPVAAAATEAPPANPGPLPGRPQLNQAPAAASAPAAEAPARPRPVVATRTIDDDDNDND